MLCDDPEMAKLILLLSLLLPAVAQRFASFDAATASSVYSSKTFGADLATTESSGYWCSAGNHEPGQAVSWTGIFRSRRQLLGLTLRWSYAPAEIKVLTSSDGGNFQESVGWSKLSRPEPSFEDTVLFPEPVNAKAVKVLMRGVKPWGYFGLSNAVAISGPSAFMLVSGAPAVQEQCLVATTAGVEAKPCIDAVVAGHGAEIFANNAAGQLQVLGGSCLGLVASKVSLVECQEGQGAWVVTQDGQVKQGNTCLVVAGSTVAAADCDDAASTGGDKSSSGSASSRPSGCRGGAGGRSSVACERATAGRAWWSRSSALFPSLRLAACEPCCCQHIPSFCADRTIAVVWRAGRS